MIAAAVAVRLANWKVAASLLIPTGMIMAEADPSGENPFFHDAFISCSRRDLPFAAAIERALKRYSPPKDLPAPHRRRNIFRDAEDFTGNGVFRVGRAASAWIAQAYRHLLAQRPRKRFRKRRNPALCQLA